ncbi:hypothetical protein J6590_034280 [Homalodisca vitripennis]|nr:hypothetical protein J6590_034280 [Homalodisca vitripennis]
METFKADGIEIERTEGAIKIQLTRVLTMRSFHRKPQLWRLILSEKLVDLKHVQGTNRVSGLESYYRTLLHTAFKNYSFILLKIL